MTSKKKLVKDALGHPEQYTPEDIEYFRMWMRERKRLKTLKKESKMLPGINLESAYKEK